MLETTKISLNIRLTSHGLIIGPVGLKSDCLSFRCKDGVQISDDVHRVNRIKRKSEVKFTLIVEKESIYSRIKASGFHKKYKCVVTTPKGQSYVATREVSRKLRDHLRVPFYISVDLNAHGLLILCHLSSVQKFKLLTIQILLFLI